MPGNLICDHCNKQIGDYSNAHFSDREKDLDFCSETCRLAWGNSDEFAAQFKKSRMPGNRLDRSLKNNENLDEVINSYRSKSIDGATAGLVYNLWVESDELSSNSVDGNRFVGTFGLNDKVYDLQASGETAVTNNLKAFTRDKSEKTNPLNGNNWEDDGLSDKEKTLYIGEILNTPLSIHAAAVLLAHMRAIKGNQRLDGRVDQEGNDDWTGENNQEFINKLTHVDEEHRLALEDFAQAASANKTPDTGWLTDDNIKYIIENNENIQQSLTRQNQNNRNWQVRTDIANIYNAFCRVRANQEWDLGDFLQESNRHRYTIYPLRVSENHWGLFILENNGINKQVYYTSSSRGVESEIEQIKPLIIKLTDRNTADNIQIIQGAKQNNGYDCGVYFVKYVQELLETGDLALTKDITEQGCQEFRQEWKQRIGEGDWCKVDVVREEGVRGDQSQQSNTSQTDAVNSIRNILLIGRTGSGKSTLANVLINEFKENEPFKEVFKESAGSVSETKQVQIQEFTVNLCEDGSEKIRYLVIDTAGFGDTQLTTKEVLQLLQELVRIIGDEGINQIFLVNSGRFTNEETDIYRLLESVLFDQEVAKYTTVIRTRFPDFEDENACETDRQNLQNENNELFNMIGSAKIIYVNNPPLVGRSEAIELNYEIRKGSNKTLIAYLGTCQGNYKPVNLNELNQRINDYQTKTEQLQKELQEKEQVRQQREAQLQQQISSLQTQQQNEISWAQQNFNSQLNAAYSEQQRQINEANARHQRELEQLRESQAVNVFMGYVCPQQHGMTLHLEDVHGVMHVICPTCDNTYNSSECGILVRSIPLEEWAGRRGEVHGERMRRLQQQIQDQESRNQEEISNISQQISQRQSSINSQRWAEENAISQRYQQTENNLRNEIQSQANEVQNAQQELNRLQNEFNSYIEQRMPSNFPWRR